MPLFGPITGQDFGSDNSGASSIFERDFFSRLGAKHGSLNKKIPSIEKLKDFLVCELGYKKVNMEEQYWNSVHSVQLINIGTVCIL